MSLSLTAKTEVLYYLGYSGLTLVESSTHFSGIVRDRLEAASESDAISSIVLRLIRSLKNIDDCLEKARCRLTASQVDNIKTNAREIEQLLFERKRYVRELSQVVALPRLNNYDGVIN